MPNQGVKLTGLTNAAQFALGREEIVSVGPADTQRRPVLATADDKGDCDDFRDVTMTMGVTDTTDVPQALQTSETHQALVPADLDSTPTDPGVTEGRLRQCTQLGRRVA